MGILSGPGRKSGDVCGEEFSAQARREQRRLGRKEPPPEGLRRIWPGASLLVGHSPTGGGCSLLAPGQIGRNKRHRIYALGHLASPPDETEPRFALVHRASSGGTYSGHR